MTVPIFSGSIWMRYMRGAYGRQLLARRGDRLSILLEDVQPAVARLRDGGLHDLDRDALDLDVHLQGGDALFRAGDLEVHVAQASSMPAMSVSTL